MSAVRGTKTIVGSCALSTVLGSIHAFSVFIPQWEGLPGADRASVSLVYSVALVSLTIAVLFGYRLYGRYAPMTIFVVVGVVAAVGLALSSRSPSLISLYLTYGLVFGGANGVGYGYALQLSGQAATARRGLAMGLVTAFYAVGATVSPLFFAYLIEKGGNAFSLQVTSVFVLLVSLVAGLLVRSSNARFINDPTFAQQVLTPVLKRVRVFLWIGYGSAVTAGLMIIGHAYSIATWLSLDAHSATLATTIVAFGNMLGGFSAGYYSDRLSSRVLLRWLPLFTAFGLLLLTLPSLSNWMVVFIGLGVVGYCYGAIIAVYPVAVADVFGAFSAPRIYGQVFTAWGLAGLLSPWVSGWLYDLTGSYIVPVLIAILFSGISALVIRHCLPKTI